MDSYSISGFLFMILSVTCLATAMRAFYLYALAHSNTLLTLGLSMGTIAISTAVGTITESHLGGNNFNGRWITYLGPTLGFLFIFLNASLRTGAQIQLLRYVHIIITILFVFLVVVTPLLPPFSSSHIEEYPLTIVRILICFMTFFRFATLYTLKETRFSLLMAIAFMLLGISFATTAPNLFQAPSAMLLNIGAGIRIIGYGTLLSSFLVKS